MNVMKICFWKKLQENRLKYYMNCWSHYKSIIYGIYMSFLKFAIRWTEIHLYFFSLQKTPGDRPDYLQLKVISSSHFISQSQSFPIQRSIKDHHTTLLWVLGTCFYQVLWRSWCECGRMGSTNSPRITKSK